MDAFLSMGKPAAAAAEPAAEPLGAQNSGRWGGKGIDKGNDMCYKCGAARQPAAARAGGVAAASLGCCHKPAGHHSVPSRP